MEVTIKEIGRKSIEWGYKVYRVEEPEKAVVQGHNVTVTINLDTYEKVETPDWLRQRFADYKRRVSGDGG